MKYIEVEIDSKEILVYDKFISEETAKVVCASIMNEVLWQEEVFTPMFESVKLKRKMAYQSDEGHDYKYANFLLTGSLWTPTTHSLKDSIEIFSTLHFNKKIAYNSVLLNYYKNGKDEIKWHSDKEPGLGENPIIACLNLGATRKFWFLNKETGLKFFYEVHSGDLLLMGPECQSKYLHAILPEKEVTESRISLTYRFVDEHRLSKTA